MERRSQYIRNKAAEVSPKEEEAIKKYFTYIKELTENLSEEEVNKKRKLQGEVLHQLRMSDKDSNNKVSKEEIEEIYKISQADITTSPEEYFELLIKTGVNNSYAAHLLSFLFSKMAENELDENIKNIFLAKAFRYKPITL